MASLSVTKKLLTIIILINDKYDKKLTHYNFLLGQVFPICPSLRSLAESASSYALVILKLYSLIKLRTSAVLKHNLARGGRNLRHLYRYFEL